MTFFVGIIKAFWTFIVGIKTFMTFLEGIIETFRTFPSFEADVTSTVIVIYTLYRRSVSQTSEVLRPPEISVLAMLIYLLHRLTGRLSN